MTYREESDTYDVDIDDSTLTPSGFIRFSFSQNGKSEDGKSMMTLYNLDFRRIIYCDIYKHDYARTIQAFKDTLTTAMKEDELLDEETVASLIVCFDNACKILKEDKNSGFFHRAVNGNGNGKGNDDAVAQQQYYQENEIPTKEVSISEALRMHSGYVKVKDGMISGSRKLEKMPTNTFFICDSCQVINAISIYSRPKFMYEINRLERSNKTRTCFNCSVKTVPSEYDHDVRNAVKIELQDVKTFSDLERLPAILFDDLYY